MEMLATHFISVMPKDTLTGMMVCSLATGKWLLHISFIYDSFRCRKFLQASYCCFVEMLSNVVSFLLWCCISHMGRQRRSSVKTLHIPVFAHFWNNWVAKFMLISYLNQNKEIKIICSLESESNQRVSPLKLLCAVCVALRHDNVKIALLFAIKVINYTIFLYGIFLRFIFYVIYLNKLHCKLYKLLVHLKELVYSLIKYCFYYKIIL